MELSVACLVADSLVAGVIVLVDFVDVVSRQVFSCFNGLMAEIAFSPSHANQLGKQFSLRLNPALGKRPMLRLQGFSKIHSESGLLSRRQFLKQRVDNIFFPADLPVSWSPRSLRRNRLEQFAGLDLTAGAFDFRIRYGNGLAFLLPESYNSALFFHRSSISKYLLSE